MTAICVGNRIYGLTKGQASPTSDEGFVTKAQPAGVVAEPFNPVETNEMMMLGDRREHANNAGAADALADDTDMGASENEFPF